MFKKPFRTVGVTKEILFAEMEASKDPKIRAMIPKLRAVKGKWSVDELFEVMCEIAGKDPKDLQK